MAEFLRGKKPAKTRDDDGFNAMGKPVPFHRCDAAYRHCKDIGLEDTADMMACVGGMADGIERDEPYKAIEVGMRYLDLTGTYRLLAVLCTAQEEGDAD